MAKYCTICGSKMLTLGGVEVCINFKSHAKSPGRRGGGVGKGTGRTPQRARKNKKAKGDQGKHK